MRKFVQIYLGFFIALPTALCIILYLVGCFISWSIIEVNIEWTYVRVYMVIAFIVSLFISMDE